ncbi:hypothetical protein TWF281_011088 [Arthrobotrys megalospora]
MKFLLSSFLFAVSATAFPLAGLESVSKIPNPDPKPNIQVAQLGEPCNLAQKITCAPGLSCLPPAGKPDSQRVCVSERKGVLSDLIDFVLIAVDPPLQIIGW